MRVKDVIRLSVLLMLIGRAMWSGPVPLGFVEGHVKIFPLSDVNLSDDSGTPNSENAQPYFEYRLIVRSREGKKEITQVAVNRNGNYRIELPPGDYFLDVQGPESRPARVKPRPFTVVSKPDGAGGHGYRYGNPIAGAVESIPLPFNHACAFACSKSSLRRRPNVAGRVPVFCRRTHCTNCTQGRRASGLSDKQASSLLRFL